MPHVQVTYNNLIELSKAALLGNTSTPIALIDGDPMLALLEASALGDLLLASAIQSAVRLMRASTSADTDLDSWMADFSFTRLPAVAASGKIRLSVSAAGAVVPVGTVFSSSESTASFSVVADTTNGYYDVPSTSYIFPAAASAYTADIDVAAIVTGADQNVAADTITSTPTPIAGVTNVTNPLEFMNGRDAESDVDYRERFKSFILSLGKANESAIISAIQSVLGARADFVLKEGTDSNGNSKDAYFTLIAENGSGTLSATEIAALTTAINAVKGLAIGFEVTTPGLLMLDITVNVTMDSSLVSTRDGAVSIITSEINTLIRSKRIGETLYYSEVIAKIMRQRLHYPIIKAVQDVIIGGTTNDDYIPNPLQLVRPGTISVVPLMVDFTLVGESGE